MRKHDYVFVPPGVRHSFTNNGTGAAGVPRRDLAGRGRRDARSEPRADAQPAGCPTRACSIGGRWSDGMRHRQVLDKYRLQPCTRVHMPSREQVTQAVAAARRGIPRQPLTPHERGAILDRAAHLLESARDELVRALQTEAGFTASDAPASSARCVQTFRLSAEEARNFGGEMVPLEGAPQPGRPPGLHAARAAGRGVRDHAVQCAAQHGGAQGGAGAGGRQRGGAQAVDAHAHRRLHAGRGAARRRACRRACCRCCTAAPRSRGWLLDEPLVRFFAFTGSTEVGRAIQQRAGLRRTQMELG